MIENYNSKLIVIVRECYHYKQNCNLPVNVLGLWNLQVKRDHYMKKCHAGQQQQYSVFAVDPESFGKDPILKDKVWNGRKNQNCHIKMDKTYKKDRDFIYIFTFQEIAQTTYIFVFKTHISADLFYSSLLVYNP